jgi:hypothetical protein
MKTYLVSYTYQNKRYSMQIKAKSQKDAESRLKALVDGKVDGELIVG